MSTTPKFHARSDSNAWILGIGGSALSLMLGLLLSAQSAPGRKARSLASAMTSEVRQLAAIVERSTNVVLTTDPQQKIAWVNAGFTQVTGYTLEEVRGTTPGPLMQFDKLVSANVAEARERLKRLEPFHGEVFHRGKSGKEYWLDVNIQPLLDEHQRFVGFVAIGTNITDRKRAEAAIAESAMLLTATNAVLEEAQAVGRIGNWSYEVASKTLTWSKQIYQLFGRDLGLPPPSLAEAIALFIPEDALRLNLAVERALGEGIEFSVTGQTNDSDGRTRHLRCECRIRRNASAVAGTRHCPDGTRPGRRSATVPRCWL